MSKREQRSKNFDAWLCQGIPSGKFFMLPPELLLSKPFQELSHAGRLFYITICTHRETETQRACLYKTLQEYNELLGLGLTEYDLLNEAYPNKHTKVNSGYFVIPTKQLAEYGYKANYVTKLKRELIEKGFIREAYGHKGRFNGWNENVTIYQFSNGWKLKRTTP